MNEKSESERTKPLNWSVRTAPPSHIVSPHADLNLTSDEHDWPAKLDCSLTTREYSLSMVGAAGAANGASGGGGAVVTNAVAPLMSEMKLRVRLECTSEKWRAEPPMSMVHNVNAAVEGVAEARHARVSPAMVRLVFVSVAVADSCKWASKTTVVMVGSVTAAKKSSAALT